MDGITALQKLLEVANEYFIRYNSGESVVTPTILIDLIERTIQELENEANSDFDSAMEGYPEE